MEDESYKYHTSYTGLEVNLIQEETRHIQNYSIKIQT